MRLADRTASLLITVGGIGTILAVSTVLLYLLWVVVPLFLPPRLADEGAVPQAVVAVDHPASLALGVDEHRRLAWEILPPGRLLLRNLATGEVLQEELLPRDQGGGAPSSLAATGEELILGYADGSVRLGRLEFAAAFAPTAEARPLPELTLHWEEPLAVSPGQPVLAVDLARQPSGEVLAVLSGDGVLRLRAVRRTKNLLTGKVRLRLRGGEAELPPELASTPPLKLLLSDLGDNAYLAWPDGRLLRWDCRDLEHPVLAETVDLLRDGAARRLTALGFLLGRTSLAAGDERGGVRVWFRIKPEGAPTPDGAFLVPAHELDPGSAAVTALAASGRKRILAVGHADGSVRLHYVPSERLLGEVRLDAETPVDALAMAPKDDGLLVAAGGGLHRFGCALPHPETTLGAIFGKVWYEGYTEPAHVWQSSSAGDDSEPKFGLVPLIFGTLKATLYSLLFAVPIALLAAVYSSEFLHPRSRARVKPAIELMASLPSVVLGFLAALVVAPWVEDYVPETVLALFTLPFACLLGAHLWQLLPGSRGSRLARLRLPAMFLTVPLGITLAALLGRPVERLLFAGDLRAWLDGRVGDGTGGLLLTLLPLSSVLVALATGRTVDPWLRRRSRGWGRPRATRIALLRFLAGTAVTVLLAWFLARFLAATGLDARGAWLGTYVQRNAAVVGFIMGFAVIPIIYTIAEDALAAVPEHLRAASLGAGATRWQTAMRVVVPTAMSGLFSAVMVGLGRAVGETMIVLMAAGNTPVLDWNVFNGLRTLSANIAVELPEAVQGSTHYRMLFLAALVLFLFTFALNTVAEVVRNRFRRRAWQL